LYHSNWNPNRPSCLSNEIFACCHKSSASVKQRRATITLGIATLCIVSSLFLISSFVNVVLAMRGRLSRQSIVLGTLCNTLSHYTVHFRHRCEKLRILCLGVLTGTKRTMDHKGVRAIVVTADHCTHAELTSGHALASCYSCCVYFLC